MELVSRDFRRADWHHCLVNFAIFCSQSEPIWNFVLKPRALGEHFLWTLGNFPSFIAREFMSDDKRRKRSELINDFFWTDSKIVRLQNFIIAIKHNLSMIFRTICVFKVIRSDAQNFESTAVWLIARLAVNSRRWISLLFCYDGWFDRSIQRMHLFGDMWKCRLRHNA